MNKLEQYESKLENLYSRLHDLEIDQKEAFRLLVELNIDDKEAMTDFILKMMDFYTEEKGLKKTLNRLSSKMLDRMHDHFEAVAKKRREDRLEVEKLLEPTRMENLMVRSKSISHIDFKQTEDGEYTIFLKDGFKFKDDCINRSNFTVRDSAHLKVALTRVYKVEN